MPTLMSRPQSFSSAGGAGAGPAGHRSGQAAAANRRVSQAASALKLLKVELPPHPSGRGDAVWGLGPTGWAAKMGVPPPHALPTYRLPPGAAARKGLFYGPLAWKPPAVDFERPWCAGHALDRAPRLGPLARSASDQSSTPSLPDHTSSVVLGKIGNISSAEEGVGSEGRAVPGAVRVAGVRESAMAGPAGAHERDLSHRVRVNELIK